VKNADSLPNKLSAYTNISLLDRLTYCEPPLFGGE